MPLEEAAAGCLPEDTVSEFVEGRLSESAARKVKSHMARCGECLRVVAEAAKFLFEEQSKSIGAAEPRSTVNAGAVLPRGAPVGRYVVIDLIGTGGMGV